MNALCLMVDMYAVSTFSPGVMLYLFDDKRGVPLWAAGERLTETLTETLRAGTFINKDMFMMIFNTFTFLGESSSRRIAYTDTVLGSRFPANRTPIFLVLTVCGIALNLSAAKCGYGALAPFGGFLIFCANGSIYNHTCRRIDSVVSRQHNLTALSFWLFVGDVGSVVGSNTMVSV